MSQLFIDKYGLVIGVSKITDGNMSVNWGEKNEVIRNREEFAQKTGVKLEECVIASLSGGVETVVVDEKEQGGYVECDAMVTTKANIGLWMVTGDCLPIVFYEPNKKILALAHSGWRGVDGKIVMGVISKMEGLGANKNLIEIWIGPGVKKETYLKYGKKLKEFKKLIGQNLDSWSKYLIPQPTKGRYGVDLISYVLEQLEESGISRDKIEVSEIDTINDKDYFSHYRAGVTGEPEGRFATVVMRKTSD